ncbi:ABC transporter ATP-binding protein [Scopulibacillus cellulosilyticus]|uniref:ABC transporter ATP-binding protein n=1 Tax=Scopulibacillus cellulosilyticus TaxID=2665665 RepID=A0ABW2Q1A1_9BACL
MSKHLLEINQLKTYFFGDENVVPAVDGVTITINKGETVGIVGESGCGKSVTSLSIMRLLKHTSGKVVDGSISFEGKDLLSLSEREMRKIRGNDIAMIFQEPMTSLNPVHKIGRQIQEAIEWHLKYSKKKSMERTIDMLKLVGIPRAEEIVNEYPYQLSGGMRQRVMIAMAMACEPKLLIADEPTTALDVTIQAQILELMKDLKAKKETAIMLITHDLGVVAEMCDRVVVMYAGKVVEEGDIYTIFENPKHPYTRGLLKSTPKLHEKRDRLGSIPGNVPSPANLPKGCKFAPRCSQVMEACLEQEPVLKKLNDGQCRCWLYQSDSEKEGVKNDSSSLS